MKTTTEAPTKAGWLIGLLGDKFKTKVNIHTEHLKMINLLFMVGLTDYASLRNYLTKHSPGSVPDMEEGCETSASI